MNLKKIINPNIRIDASNNYVNTSKGNFIDLLKTDEKITLIDGPKRLKKKVSLIGFRKKDYLDTIICVEDANGLIRDIEIKYWQ
tara:strand:+ start:194 stop:445 length:252 start_codon:yes stop_codon:yes gene_type:complete